MIYRRKILLGKKFKKSDKSCVGIINILFKLYQSIELNLFSLDSIKFTDLITDFKSENLAQKGQLQKSSHLVRDKKQAIQQDFRMDFFFKTSLSENSQKFQLRLFPPAKIQKEQKLIF